MQLPLSPDALRQFTALYEMYGTEEYKYVRDHGFRGCDPAS